MRIKGGGGGREGRMQQGSQCLNDLRLGEHDPTVQLVLDVVPLSLPALTALCTLCRQCYDPEHNERI
jgi:hypothetical protein